MAGRPSHRVRSKEKVQELNVLPVMNVFAILVPFLLLSAAFVQLTIVDTSLPARGSGESTKEPEDDKPKLNLTVFIRDDGFMLAGYGGVLLLDEQNGGETPPEGGEAPASTRFTIEKKEIEGKLDFDWDRLRETLVKVKEAYPKHFRSSCCRTTGSTTRRSCG
ncbi:MAG: biopolymer transporter ExbD [Deltaproteobacteria bacterium]|nr:biopolymer transporter ExbD [Deltaproteobacteria bacterium]